MNAPAANNDTASMNSAWPTGIEYGLACPEGESNVWCAPRYATQPTIQTMRQRSRRVRKTSRLAARMRSTAVSRVTNLGVARLPRLSQARHKTIFIHFDPQPIPSVLARKDL